MAHALPLGPGAPVLAFDIGGTDIKGALIDEAGQLLGLRRVPTIVSEDATFVDRLGCSFLGARGTGC